MTNNIFKTGAGLLALFGAMTLASCSDKDEMQAVGDANADSNFSLAIKGMPAAATGTLGVRRSGRHKCFPIRSRRPLQQERYKFLRSGRNRSRQGHHARALLRVGHRHRCHRRNNTSRILPHSHHYGRRCSLRSPLSFGIHFDRGIADEL